MKWGLQSYVPVTAVKIFDDYLNMPTRRKNFLIVYCLESRRKTPKLNETNLGLFFETPFSDERTWDVQMEGGEAGRWWWSLWWLPLLGQFCCRTWGRVEMTMRPWGNGGGEAVLCPRWRSKTWSSPVLFSFFSPPLLTVASIRFYRTNMGSPPKKTRPYPLILLIFFS